MDRQVLGWSWKRYFLCFLVNFALMGGCVNSVPGERASVGDDEATRADLFGALGYHAEAVLVSAPELELWAKITVANHEVYPQDLVIGDCALFLALFRDADRRQLAWRSTGYRYPPRSGAIRDACFGGLRRYRVQPAASLQPYELRARYPVNAILGDSLAEGRYFFALQVQLMQELMTVEAGSGELVRRGNTNALPLASGRTVNIQPATHVEGGMFQLRATVHNRAHHALVLAHESEPVGVELHPEEYATRAWWAERRWTGAHPSLRIPVSSSLPQWEVLPSAGSAEPSGFRKAIPVSEILGDTLLPGLYRTALDVFLFRDTITIGGGVVSLQRD